MDADEAFNKVALFQMRAFRNFPVRSHVAVLIACLAPLTWIWLYLGGETALTVVAVILGLSVVEGLAVLAARRFLR